MISNPRPTRAEVTDIANAIYSRTDALMLSGETASGKYPLEAVQTMSSIAEQAENDIHRYAEKNGAASMYSMSVNDQKEFLAQSAIAATEKIGVKGIITDSLTGQTARNLAAFRGPTPILAICYKDNLQRILNLSYGVIPVFQKDRLKPENMFYAALRMLRQKGYISTDDNVAYLSGSLGEQSSTTFLEINKVAEVFDKNYQFHMPR